MRRLLGTLPPAQREVMTLAYEGLTGREIATLLGKDPATVRKNLQLARDRLRRDPDVSTRRREVTRR